MAAAKESAPVEKKKSFPVPAGLKPSKVLKVKATRLSYVGNKRRRIGQVFQIRAHEFEPAHMALLEGNPTASVYERRGQEAIDAARPKPVEEEFDRLEDEGSEESEETSGSSSGDVEVI